MSKSVSVLTLVMLGMTCLLHVTRAQPAPAASEAQARLFDEDISELEGQPLIEYKVVTDDEKFINSRLIDLSNVLGFLYFSWHVLRPEDPIPDLNDFFPRRFGSGNEKNGTNVEKDYDGVFSRSYEIVMNSLDPVGASLEYLGVQTPHCKQRAMCTARRAIASFSLAESAAQRLGWLLGSFPKYEDALRHGRQLHDCKEHYPKCDSLPLPFL